MGGAAALQVHLRARFDIKKKPHKPSRFQTLRMYE